MNAIRHAFVCAALPVALILNAGSALAERVDRDKPINLEANRITIDEAKKVQVFEGNVHLVQGTMTIRADKIVVSQDVDGFQKGSAFGGVKGRSQLPDYVQMYLDGKLEVDRFITHTLPLSDINRAFELMGQGQSIRSVVYF